MHRDSSSSLRNTQEVEPRRQRKYLSPHLIPQIYTTRLRESPPLIRLQIAIEEGGGRGQTIHLNCPSHPGRPSGPRGGSPDSVRRHLNASSSSSARPSRSTTASIHHHPPPPPMHALDRAHPSVHPPCIAVGASSPFDDDNGGAHSWRARNRAVARSCRPVPRGCLI